MNFGAPKHVIGRKEGFIDARFAWLIYGHILYACSLYELCSYHELVAVFYFDTDHKFSCSRQTLPPVIGCFKNLDINHT